MSITLPTPFRTEYTPSPAVLAYNWPLAIRWGEAAAEENPPPGGRTGPVRKWEIWWELFQSAIEVSRIAYRAPPRTGYPAKSMMPEAPDEITYWQKQAAYLRGDLSELPVDDSKPPRPSAAEVSRAECVLEVYHNVALIGAKDWRRKRQAVFLRGSGVPAPAVRARTGLPKQTVQDAKVRAMRDMADFVALIASSTK